MARLTLREAITEALREEMQRDDNVFIMGEEVADWGGTYAVTKGFLEEFGPRRVRDTPISEMVIAGAATGAAMAGLRPVAEFMTINFAFVAFDAIINHATKVSYMFNGQMNCPVVFRAPGGGGKQLGATHSHTPDVIFAHFPGLKVVCPATPYDAKGLLKSAIRDDNPVVFLEHKLLYFTRGEAPAADEEYTIPIGKADVKRKGSDLTIATFSYCVLQALEAAEELSETHGIEVEVVDLRSVEPLDIDTVLASVAKTGRLLAVHESYANSGIGAEIVAQTYEIAPYLLKSPARRLGMAPVSIPVSKTLEEEILPWKRQMVATVLEMMG